MTVKLTASLANKELRELCKLHLATQEQAVCNQIDILRITSIFQDGCIKLHSKNISPEPLQQFLIMYSPLLKELIIEAFLVICYQFYCKNCRIVDQESRQIHCSCANIYCSGDTPWSTGGCQNFCLFSVLCLDNGAEAGTTQTPPNVFTGRLAYSAVTTAFIHGCLVSCEHRRLPE
jgi:hypothetical protein